MDDADLSDEKQEELLRRRLAYLSSRPLEAEATGQCLNCEVQLPEGVRWCDSDCQLDWKRRNTNDRYKY